MTKKKITTTTITETIVDDAPKQTYIAILLDASGSMGPRRSDTIGGFNSLIQTYKDLADLGGETYVSLFTFGEAPFPYSPKAKLVNASAKQLQPLTEKNYAPYGNTQLLDALGLALTTLEPYDTADGNVAFKIELITDGEETDSKLWTGPDLARKVRELEATGRWTITGVGATNLDQFRRKTGIRQAVAYNPDQQGTAFMFNALNGSTQSYMASRSAGAQSYGSMYAAASCLDGVAAQELTLRGAKDVSEALEKAKAEVAQRAKLQQFETKMNSQNDILVPS